MANSIFRKTSLERINSPEQLNDYIRVIRPGAWLVLGAVVLLLAGVLIWSLTGEIDGVQPIYFIIH